MLFLLGKCPDSYNGWVANPPLAPTTVFGPKAFLVAKIVARLIPHFRAFVMADLQMNCHTANSIFWRAGIRRYENTKSVENAVVIPFR